MRHTHREEDTAIEHCVPEVIFLPLIDDARRAQTVAVEVSPLWSWLQHLVRAVLKAKGQMSIFDLSVERVIY